MFGYSPLIDPFLQYRHFNLPSQNYILLNDFLLSEFHLEGGGDSDRVWAGMLIPIRGSKL